MDTHLRQLSPSDGMDVYEMLQELPADENGFINGMHGRSAEDFRHWLTRSDLIAQGIGLEDWMVPQSTFWLYVDGRPVGMGKVRHRLTEKLLSDGGHIGYAIRPSCRGKGYGKTLLRLLLEEARKLGIDRVLVTVRNHNTPSIRTALASGGVVEKVSEERHYIWIESKAPGS